MLSLDQKENIDIFGENFCPEFPDKKPNEIEEDEIERWKKSRCKTIDTENSIKRIMDDLNVMGGGDEVYYGIARQIVKSHRTLQQSFAGIALRAIIDTFAMMDKEDGWTDERNEASAKLGTELKKVMDEHHLPFM